MPKLNLYRLKTAAARRLRLINWGTVAWHTGLYLTLAFCTVLLALSCAQGYWKAAGLFLGLCTALLFVLSL